MKDLSGILDCCRDLHSYQVLTVYGIDIDSPIEKLSALSFPEHQWTTIKARDVDHVLEMYVQDYVEPSSVADARKKEDGTYTCSLYLFAVRNPETKETSFHHCRVACIPRVLNRTEVK